MVRGVLGGQPRVKSQEHRLQAASHKYHGRNEGQNQVQDIPRERYAASPVLLPAGALLPNNCTSRQGRKVSVMTVEKAMPPSTIAPSPR